MSTPNTFGDYDHSLIRKQMLTMSNEAFKDDDKRCHRDIEHILCLLLYPKCHNPTFDDDRSGTNISATHLVTLCKDTCYKVRDECEGHVTDNFFNIISDCCTYFPKSSSEKSVCLDFNVTCKIPPIEIPNGRRVAFSGSENNNTCSLGSNATYQCSEGHTMTGSPYVVCELSGHWSKLPNCDRVTCQMPLPVVANGIRIAFDRNNSKATYECLEGYNMTGSPDVKCTLLGQWSELPNCTYMYDSKTSEMNLTKKDSYIWLTVILGILLFGLMMLIMISFWWFSHRKTKNKFHDLPLIESRNREYDALVLSCQDVSDTEKSVIEHITSECNVKSVVEPEEPEGVHHFVGRSNSVVVLVSQKFIESNSCLKNFEICKEENDKDSSFRVIIVVTQPKELLQNVPQPLQKYLEIGTTLQQHDENFWNDLRREIMAVKTVYLLRGHSYATFLCYYSRPPTKEDSFPISDEEKYVNENILARFDENCGGKYKICHHRVDFVAGIPVMENIQRAVHCSKCAIIVLSQDFVNSDWCRDEFEMCMAKNRRDPTYTLYVILMQPRESLHNLTPYMKKFFRNNTYLERDDKDLWTKLDKCIAQHASMSVSHVPKRAVLQRPNHCMLFNNFK